VGRRVWMKVGRATPDDTAHVSWQSNGMATKGYRSGSSTEISWIVCESCGALVPRAERSSAMRMLHGLCCGIAGNREPECGPRAEFVAHLEHADRAEESQRMRIPRSTR
jgi:hypothetical protein